MRYAVSIFMFFLLLPYSTNLISAQEDSNQFERPRDPSAEILQPAAVIGAEELNELPEFLINKSNNRNLDSSTFEPKPDFQQKEVFGINLNALLMALIVMVALSLSLSRTLSHNTV